MKKITLLFPGQGSQYVGMGKDLYNDAEKVKQTFEEANDTLGFDLKKLCFEGDINELTQTENAQPAILTVSVAYYRVYLERFGMLPLCAAGHSLGEYSALTCSGAIKFSDALKIVRKRGMFMQEASAAGKGGMSAIGKIDIQIIREECKKASTSEQIVVVSNHNSPGQIVISGHVNAVEAAGSSLKLKGAVVTPLPVSAAFHSPLMETVAEKMKDELNKYKYTDFQFPVLSNVTALPYKDSSEIVPNLTRQVVNPVMWYDSMQYLKKIEISLALELGPKTVLKNLVKENIAGVKAYSYDKKQDCEEFMNELKNDNTQDTNGISVVTRCMAIAVCTRNRNWDNDEYQKGVSEPYKKIQQMQEDIESKSEKPSVEQMKQALEMLRSVFITKKVPVEEQIERFNQVFNETNTRQLFPDFEMPKNN